MNLRRCIALTFCVWTLGSAVNAQSVIDIIVKDFKAEPDVSCVDVPVLERLKYAPCRHRYNKSELAAYLEEFAAIRRERFEAKQARLWEWLTLRPSPNCETLPDLEKAKYDYHCLTAVLGGSNYAEDLVSQLTALKNQRDELAQRIASLRERYNEISASGFTTDAPVNEGQIAVLQSTLARLDAGLIRLGLLEKFAEIVSEDMGDASIRRIAFVELPSGVELYATPEDGSELLGTIEGAGETVIRVEAAAADEPATFVHPRFGRSFTKLDSPKEE